jgi:hypothetical protein
MSELENLLNPPKTTNVRWDLPESTMAIIKGYQKQMWAATGKYPALPQIIVHMIEYVGKDACDKYFGNIQDRIEREKEARKDRQIERPFDRNVGDYKP